MGDHFVLLVDRLLTESTLEAAIESRNRLKEAEVATYDCASHEIVIGDESYPRKVIECRICQDEDVDLNMESPCSCRGSLKYAHRRCVQRWCNEKGDTLCEICHQQFKPGYTVPPPLFQFDGIPMNFRGHWDISQRDFNNPRLVTMVSTDHNFLGIDEEDDEYSASASRSLTCCRLVAVIFTCLLILRHALPVILNKSSYSFPVLLVRLITAIAAHRNSSNFSLTCIKLLSFQSLCTVAIFTDIWYLTANLCYAPSIDNYPTSSPTAPSGSNQRNTLLV